MKDESLKTILENKLYHYMFQGIVLNKFARINVFYTACKFIDSEEIKIFIDE